MAWNRHTRDKPSRQIYDIGRLVKEALELTEEATESDADQNQKVSHSKSSKRNGGSRNGKEWKDYWEIVNPPFIMNT